MVMTMMTMMMMVVVLMRVCEGLCSVQIRFYNNGDKKFAVEK